MRIMMVTQWFDPEPVPKGLGFAKAIAAAGHKVEVVTGFPNYPGGKLYPGYRVRWREQTSIDGVVVTRVPLYPSHDSSRLGRALNYATFFLSSLLYSLFAAPKADVIYCYHPPLTAGLSAAIVSRIRRIPLVYDIQDLWPDTLAATGMIGNRRLLDTIGELCRVVYRQAAAITVLSPGFKQKMIERGVPEQKVSVIYNWCEESKILATTYADKPSVLQDRFNVIFAGTMGRAQALDAVLDAARIIGKQAPEVQIVLVGGGIDVDRLRKEAADCSNVRFLPPMPMDEIGKYLLAADALLVHLRRDPLFAVTIPSKTQAFMAVGRPVIMAVRGDAAKLVTEARAGIVAEPENPESIAVAIMELMRIPGHKRDELGENGRRYYLENLSMQAGVTKYLDIFNRLITRQT